jgi:hypothetical protein
LESPISNTHYWWGQAVISMRKWAAAQQQIDARIDSGEMWGACNITWRMIRIPALGVKPWMLFLWYSAIR